MNFVLTSDVNNRREKKISLDWVWLLWKTIRNKQWRSEKLCSLPGLRGTVHLESLLNDTEEIEIAESFYSSNQRTQEMTISQWLTPSSLRSLSSTVPLQFGNECSVWFLFHTENMQVVREEDSNHLHGREKLQCFLHNCDLVHFTVEWCLCNEEQKWPRVMAWPPNSHLLES